MSDDARQRYTAAITGQARARRVALAGETSGRGELVRDPSLIVVAGGVDTAEVLVVFLPPSGVLTGPANTAIKAALRRGIAVLIDSGGSRAAFPDCRATPLPAGGYRLHLPDEGEAGPATSATLAVLYGPPAAAVVPPPVMSAEQLAADGLREARRPITPDAVAKLSPYPRPDDPAQRSAWLQLVRGGTLPTPAAVTDRAARTAARRAREVAAAKEAAAVAKRDGPAAAAAVAVIVRDTGTGPSWAELGTAMGWPPNTHRGVIPRLTRASWLTHTSETRSLRPGTRYTPSGRTES